MNVGLIGTGAIAEKHAQAYRTIGFTLALCTNRNQERGRSFAERHNTKFAVTAEEVCQDPSIDYIDVCTFPELRRQVVELCAKFRKHVLVQKPIATNLIEARQMISIARNAGIVLGVVSQHRFDESSRFLIQALQQNRLGRILQCDCYVKWYRPQRYYDPPGKGSWKVEGGGVLINQAIHQIDLIRWFAGPIKEVFGMWQIATAHGMESEDVISAVLRYRSGATGIVQASTAFWPGYSERIEIHGTKGSAIVTGDRLTLWDVPPDNREPAPLSTQSQQSGASDPMAISLESFERQFKDFANAIRIGRNPLVGGKEGFDALAVVTAIYDSCRNSEVAPVAQLENDLQ